jgi:tripartite-type tricarboxylate transporter receptor subunit TctC
VARSAPDGSTLMVGPPGPLAINRFLYTDLSYDAAQLTPIVLLAKVPNVLTVRSTLPLKSLAGIIAYAKQHPDALTYATQGAGSTAFLTTSRLQKLAGISMVHVPYRGAALALNDLIAGHVDLMFDTLTTSLPLHRAGKARIVAVAGSERTAALPDIPTVQESGLPGFRSVTWFALVGPPGMPGALTARINRDVVDALGSADITARLHELKLEPGGGTPAETARFIAEESELWGRIVKEANVKLQ